MRPGLPSRDADDLRPAFEPAEASQARAVCRPLRWAGGIPDDAVAASDAGGSV